MSQDHRPCKFPENTCICGETEQDLSHIVWTQAFDLYHPKGLYFTVLPECSSVLKTIDSKGASHQNDTCSRDHKGAFTR